MSKWVKIYASKKNFYQQKDQIVKRKYYFANCRSVDVQKHRQIQKEYKNQKIFSIFVFKKQKIETKNKFNYFMYFQKKRFKKSAKSHCNKILKETDTSWG